MAWTKPFSEIAKDDAATAGGKGASLGEMTQAGIPVPPGFVLLSSAFEHFLEQTDLNIEIDAILKTVESEVMHTVEDASEKIQALILSKEIPDDIQTEIVSDFQGLDAEFVAVRSSATAEDSASAAWAGQLDTFLNTTESTLLENIRRCWASLFTPRAIFYRFEKGLHAEKVSVAVVIQKMVNSESAGIAFSVHPVTEDRNQMIIEAAFGLGEAVVSGQITPDSYVVTKEPLAILDKNLIEQNRALYRKAGGGNEWVTLSPEKGKEQEISDSQILELAALIMKIENHYRFPVDVEWAREGGKFYITQSRPITTLPQARPIQWVKFHTRNFGLFRYYVYAESNKLPFYRKHFGKAFDYVLTVPDGKLVGYYHDEQELRELGGRMFSVACKDARTFEKFSKQIFGWMHDFIAHNHQLAKMPFADMPSTRLEKLYDEWYEKYLLWQIGIYFYFTLEPIVTEKFNSALENYLRETDAVGELPALAEAVMSPEVMNAVNLEELSALENALKVKQYPKRKHELVARHHKKFLWMPCYDVHHDAFDEKHFAERIGMLARKTKPVLQKELKEFKANFARRKLAFAHAVATLSDTRLANLARIMHSLVYYKDLRDDLRREASYAAKPFMEALAERFGLTLEEINFLTPPEVKALFHGKTVAKARIHARIPSNYVLMSISDAIELHEGAEARELLNRELPQTSAAAGSAIIGLIAQKGVVRGKVVIIRHSLALSRVGKGDILVALTTHPEYVPAMKKAAGFVTDEGGITSHAAIVARELHKPCIVGAKNATQILKDGDMVEVDADKGIVRILSK